MKTQLTIKEISAEAMEFITANRDKLVGETNMAVFTKDEKFKMRAVYKEITGRVAPTNCNGLCQNALKIIKNWIAIHESKILPTVEELTEPTDLNSYTKKELIKMYPGVPSKLSKQAFIEAINNG